ncbi:NEAT domain-containing protein [Paenibacillus radicis (ex Gao et al. 2016)]|uniref:NEAT domain-containing protein n=1 Tax=Paenibacillus radicis (ex Gao et al. 2016) TaxID=1737354 RepID=A0A917HKW5_9BACL|nr:NEAT domain-containing protein [Paenibacillus radicis (ex Gao et al. 2016)]GGG81489.1 hypothetical protein GCM10010918_43420 [Paenibacillus radicis (ex Gao et al. 2016)]
MVIKFRKNLVMFMLLIAVAVAYVTPAFAATFPDDGTYKIQYAAYSATSTAPSMLTGYIAAPAVVVADGNSFTVTVEFTNDSYIQNFRVNNGAGYVEATSVTPATAGNYAFQFTTDDLDSYVNIQIYVDIPSSVYPPNGYQYTRDARLLFNTAGAVEA